MYMMSCFFYFVLGILCFWEVVLFSMNVPVLNHFKLYVWSLQDRERVIINMFTLKCQSPYDAF